MKGVPVLDDVEAMLVEVLNGTAVVVELVRAGVVSGPKRVRRNVQNRRFQLVRQSSVAPKRIPSSATGLPAQSTLCGKSQTRSDALNRVPIGQSILKATPLEHMRKPAQSLGSTEIPLPPLMSLHS